MIELFVGPLLSLVFFFEVQRHKQFQGISLRTNGGWSATSSYKNVVVCGANLFELQETENCTLNNRPPEPQLLVNHSQKLVYELNNFESKPQNRDFSSKISVHYKDAMVVFRIRSGSRAFYSVSTSFWVFIRFCFELEAHKTKNASNFKRFRWILLKIRIKPTPFPPGVG